MRIDTKYDFDQEVWFVDECFDDLPCPACETKGKVMLNGKEYNCPNCYGEGLLIDNGNDFIYKPYSGMIGQVNVFQDSFHYRLRCSHRSHVQVTEEELFLTEAEAQAEADRMNEERKQVSG